MWFVALAWNISSASLAGRRPSIFWPWHWTNFPFQENSRLSIVFFLFRIVFYKAEITPHAIWQVFILCMKMSPTELNRAVMSWRFSLKKVVLYWGTCNNICKEEMSMKPLMPTLIVYCMKMNKEINKIRRRKMNKINKLFFYCWTESE